MITLKQAVMEGRAAAPGTRNPYSGDGPLASAWMAGYKTMLVAMLRDSPARQQFLENQQ